MTADQIVCSAPIEYSKLNWFVWPVLEEAQL